MRVDAGVAAGTAVGVEYDPLLAKLVVHAADRGAAIERARRALSEWIVLGVETNAALLAEVLEAPEFLSGRVLDGPRREDPLPRETIRPSPSRSEPPDAAWIAAALALSSATSSARSETSAVSGAGADPWDEHAGWRPGA